MSKALLFHERDIQFDIAIPHSQAEELPSEAHTPATAPADARRAWRQLQSACDLYITGDNIFIGKDLTWYRMQVSEIERISWRIRNQKLTLDFSDYLIELGTVDPVHLRTVRHFLMLYRSLIRRGGAA